MFLKRFPSTQRCSQTCSRKLNFIQADCAYVWYKSTVVLIIFVLKIYSLLSSFIFFWQLEWRHFFVFKCLCYINNEVTWELCNLLSLTILSRDFFTQNSSQTEARLDIRGFLTVNVEVVGIYCCLLKYQLWRQQTNFGNDLVFAHGYCQDFSSLRNRPEVISCDF